MTSEREYQAYDAIARFCIGATVAVILFTSFALVQRLDDIDTQAAQQQAGQQAGKTEARADN